MPLGLLVTALCMYDLVLAKGREWPKIREASNGMASKDPRRHRLIRAALLAILSRKQRLNIN